MKLRRRSAGFFGEGGAGVLIPIEKLGSLFDGSLVEFAMKLGGVGDKPSTSAIEQSGIDDLDEVVHPHDLIVNVYLMLGLHADENGVGAVFLIIVKSVGRDSAIKRPPEARAERREIILFLFLELEGLFFVDEGHDGGFPEKVDI